MNEKLKQLWRSNYVRLREEEVARLRAENREGFPPVESPEAPKPQPLPRLGKPSWQQIQAWHETEANRDNSANFDEPTSDLRRRMDLYRTAESWTGIPGTIAPADGNLASGPATASLPAGLAPLDGGEKRQQDAGATDAPFALGPNNERLEEVKPELVNALRELVRQYRQEGIVALRHEIRRIRQARLFWPGLQYVWWNPNDMN